VAKRLFDILASFTALILLSPILLIAGVGIRLSSPGAILYRARRAGRGGKPFTMHKFRTMRTDQGADASAITSSGDSRVFRFGSLLRRLKIDELPQLYDVLRGTMSLVGPRPEDTRIVRTYYAPEHMETLAVRPGLASPGGIYNYTHGEKLIGQENPQQDYLDKLLPVKLALELVYVRKASLCYDLRVMLRTGWVIVLVTMGKREFRDPPEMAQIDRIVPVRTSQQPMLS
jgi:lipopolysaccharide/colanic/teichoic acid biosynthesis glycosyltransferase